MTGTGDRGFAAAEKIVDRALSPPITAAPIGIERTPIRIGARNL